MFFLGICFYFVKRATSIFTKKCKECYLAVGKEKYSSEKIRIIFINLNKNSINYFSNLIFDKKPNITQIEDKLNDNKNILASYPDNVDLILTKQDRFHARYFQKKGFFVIPRMISMCLDVSDSLENIYYKFNRTIRKKVNKINKSNYSYETTDDINKFDLFYNKMYVPYAKFRYGDRVMIGKYVFVRSIFENGKLLFVKDDEKPILGVIFYRFNKNDVVLSYMGMLEGSFDYLYKDIGAVSTFFSIKWAKNNEIKNLNFGFCRSFLNNGVFQHNKMWGTYVEKYRNYFFNVNYDQVYGLKILNYSNATRSFLENNPFVFYKKDLNVMIFCNGKLTCDIVRRMYNKYYINGLSKLYIGSTDNIDKNVKDFTRFNYFDKIVLLDKEETDSYICG